MADRAEALHSATLHLSGIYAIRNIVDGKIYVGSALRVRVRWLRHIRDLRSGQHHNRKLQRAWAKHGEAAFCFEVLEAVTDPIQLVPREQVWIDRFDAATRGYNLCPVAGSSLGVVQSQETRQRRSQSMKGNTNGVGFRWSDAQRAEMSARRTGSRRSAETRAKQSAAAKGNKANSGRKFSDEHRAKISAARCAYFAKLRSASGDDFG